MAPPGPRPGRLSSAQRADQGLMVRPEPRPTRNRPPQPGPQRIDRALPDQDPPRIEIRPLDLDRLLDDGETPAGPPPVAGLAHPDSNGAGPPQPRPDGPAGVRTGVAPPQVAPDPETLSRPAPDLDTGIASPAAKAMGGSSRPEADGRERSNSPVVPAAIAARDQPAASGAAGHAIEDSSPPDEARAVPARASSA